MWVSCMYTKQTFPLKMSMQFTSAGSVYCVDCHASTCMYTHQNVFLEGTMGGKGQYLLILKTGYPASRAQYQPIKEQEQMLQSRFVIANPLDPGKCLFISKVQD